MDGAADCGQGCVGLDFDVPQLGSDAMLILPFAGSGMTKFKSTQTCPQPTTTFCNT